MKPVAVNPEEKNRGKWVPATPFNTRVEAEDEIRRMAKVDRANGTKVAIKRGGLWGRKVWWVMYWDDK